MSRPPPDPHAAVKKEIREVEKRISLHIHKAEIYEQDLEAVREEARVAKERLGLAKEERVSARDGPRFYLHQCLQLIHPYVLFEPTDADTERVCTWCRAPSGGAEGETRGNPGRDRAAADSSCGIRSCARSPPTAPSSSPSRDVCC